MAPDSTQLLAPELILEQGVEAVGPVTHAADVEGEVLLHLWSRADGEGVPLTVAYSEIRGCPYIT